MRLTIVQVSFFAANLRTHIHLTKIDRRIKVKVDSLILEVDKNINNTKFIYLSMSLSNVNWTNKYKYWKEYNILFYLILK
jgi:hypothetical protein